MESEGKRETSFSTQSSNKQESGKQEPTFNQEVKTISSSAFLKLLKEGCGSVVTDRHLVLYRELLEVKDPGVLIDIQPHLSFCVSQELGLKLAEYIVNIRKYVGVYIHSNKDCKQRLTKLKGILSTEEDKKLVTDTIQLIDLPVDSEYSSDADLKLITLIPKLKTRRDIVELQEIVMYLTSLFEMPPPPDSQQQPKPKGPKKSKAKKQQSFQQPQF